MHTTAFWLTFPESWVEARPEPRPVVIPAQGLSDLVLGLLIAVFGLVAARRFPALLEMALLSRLDITAGSRYAIATLQTNAYAAFPG